MCYYNQALDVPNEYARFRACSFDKIAGWGEASHIRGSFRTSGPREGSFSIERVTRRTVHPRKRTSRTDISCGQCRGARPGPAVRRHPSRDLFLQELQRWSRRGNVYIVLIYLSGKGQAVGSFPPPSCRFPPRRGGATASPGEV